MRIRFGDNTLDYPSDELGEMRDSSQLIGDPGALRERMREDGYLLLRGLIDRGQVLAAITEILGYMAEHEGLEADELFGFYQDYLESRPRTFDYKWLRAVGNERFTGCHYDVVYMGRGSERVHTAWIPLGDIPIEQGTLAVCAGSHSDPGFARLRETYGCHDVDRDRGAGWFSTDRWRVSCDERPIAEFRGDWGV
jgi:hypothetical protein